MNNRTMVEIKNVSKVYQTGVIGGKTLKGDLQSWWAHIRNQPDPNEIIGTSKKQIGKKFLALDKLNLTIKEGEAVGIIGRNGAGKSTLLKLISRVTTPSNGSITLRGRVASMLEVGTGFHPELTGRENVYMNGAILGMSKHEIDSKFNDIVEFSEVGPFIDTPVKRYSSGMYVKLAFAVAAHLNSEILIMDEVLAVGDMAFQHKCLNKMKKAAQQENKTILYVSHNMNTIRELCDRCIVLDRGTLIFDGDVEEAISIYLNESVNSLASDIDLSSNRMEHLPKEIIGKITRLRFIDREQAVFKYGEKVQIGLNISFFKKISNVSIRLELRSKSGYPVGITKINNIGNATENCEGYLEMLIDWEGLVPGEYTVCLVLYSVNEFGSYFDIDAVYPACIFKMTDSDNNLGVQWNPKNWGYVNFKEAEILKNNLSESAGGL